MEVMLIYNLSSWHAFYEKLLADRCTFADGSQPAFSNQWFLTQVRCRSAAAFKVLALFTASPNTHVDNDFINFWL